MNALSDYSDRQIVQALLDRDEKVTAVFFFEEMKPVITHHFNSFYTDCSSVEELTSQLYLHLLTPSVATGKCGLESFRADSSLAGWFFRVTRNYCSALYRKRGQNEAATQPLTNVDVYLSEDINTKDLDRADLQVVLGQVSAGHKNENFAKAIMLRYVDDLSIEDTAKALNVSRRNCDTILFRARREMVNVLGNPRI